MTPAPANRNGTAVPAQRGRDTLWRRLWRGACRLRERSDWEQFAGSDWAERIMDVAVTDDFHVKQGRSTGRWLLEKEGQRLAVYLKRHYRLPWWQGLLAALWPGRGWSPALVECRNLEWAHAHGFPVPAVVAAGEFIGPWGRMRSFLAIEELTGMAPLHQAIPEAAANLDPAGFLQWKRGLAVELARLTRDLHDRRAFHKDCYFCHFFIPRTDVAQVPPDWRGRVHLIDLHRLGRHPWTWRLWQLKDLAQLLYSSDVPGVTARDCLRFWRYYQGRDRRRGIIRFLASCIRLKARRYQRHNAKRAKVSKGEHLNGQPK